MIRSIPQSLAVSVLLACAACASDPHATAHVNEGKQACAEIRLPGCWHYSSRRDCIGYQSVGLHDHVGYRLSLATNQPDTILVASYHDEPRLGHGDVAVDSPERYAITLGKKVRIRPATDEEWKDATPLPPFFSEADGQHNSFYPGRTDQRPYVYAGRNFVKTGPIWAANAPSRISGDHEYIAIQSWDGRGGGAGDWLPSPSWGENTGRYWIAIYNVATGRRRIAITGKTHDIDGDFFLGGSEFFGRHYFLLPLSQTLNPFLVCNLDAVQESQK